MTNRLVFKEKKDQYDNIVKFKARLVVKGFMQIKGFDYNETFVFIIILPIWRILLVIAAVKNWEIEQIDYIGAFLNSDLKKDIYIQIPEGFNVFVKKMLKEKNKIAKLLKSLSYNPSEKQIVLFAKALYSLKQSSKEWQLKLKDQLKKLGFKPLISDSAVFYNPRIGVL